MPINAAQAQQLADLLPNGLRCTDARERLLCLTEILRTLTDAEHTLSNADIRAILHARFGASCAPAENTIGADLRAIRDSGALGLHVHISPAGAWCERTDLGPAKVRMLLNAVQASRFLTTAQSAELQESLFGLVSRHQEEDLEGQVVVERRTRESYQTVFDTCDTIARAIRAGRKIEFNYAFNGFDGKPSFLASDTGELLRVETPIALLFSENNYYVETYADTPWRHGTHIMNSRVDRMYNVRVSGERATANADVRQARKSITRRKRESFDMVDGPRRTIFLRVRADYTNVMFDKFGFGLKFGQFSGEVGNVDTSAVTCVPVAESFTFYRWLSAAGSGIVLERPKSEMWVQSGPWDKAVEGKSLKELRADYEAVRAGYLAFLDRAREPYA